MNIANKSSEPEHITWKLDIRVYSIKHCWYTGYSIRGNIFRAVATTHYDFLL